MKRVSLRDIANEVGMHVSTVSLALRNHRKIPETTRVRIAEAAERMNYRPDPMMSALCAYRQTCRTADYQGTIAWIDTYLTPGPYWYDGYFRGAQARAGKMGYTIERFWLREKGMKPSRLNSVLKSRGIQGVLLAPQPITHAHLRLSWEDFSAVRFGYSLTRPELHMVTSHQFLNTMTCFRRTARMGFKKIGLVLSNWEDERVSRCFSGGFAAAQATVPGGDRFPPCLYDSGSDRWDNKEISEDNPVTQSILAWAKKYRPDAIITLSSQLQAILNRAGFSITVIYIAIDEESPDSEKSGIIEQRDEIGAAAMEFVSDMIRRGERGIPKIPRILMVPGEWRAAGRTKTVKTC
ncbi:MAG: LacI family DNA-binding transcriptional regulator [Gloeobacteraceae cyanobacterium ES-bin-144]|nr:LacI family DNA-binding transcriptional regulator [Verrucomicrobiales bacterium]